MRLHEDLTRDFKLKSSSERSFGLVFAVVLAAVALAPVRHGGDVRLWAALLSGSFAGAALLRPSVLRPMNLAWTRFGLLLARLTNPIVTGLMFYALVTPAGLIARIMGKDPLRLQLDADLASYWLDRTPPGPQPKSMERQF